MVMIFSFTDRSNAFEMPHRVINDRASDGRWTDLTYRFDLNDFLQRLSVRRFGCMRFVVPNLVRATHQQHRRAWEAAEISNMNRFAPPTGNKQS